MIRFALTLLFFVLSGLAVAGTATSPTVTEGNNAIITFDLGYTAPVGGVEVFVATNSATATLGTDFTVAGSQLGYRTIAAGDKTLTVTAAIINDGLSEGNETFPVAFLENVSSNASFDGGATEWSDKSIRTQPNVDFTSSSPPMSNNVLHIQNKETPFRSVSLNSGTDYDIEFDWSEANADGYGSSCDDSSMYPGYVNAADRLVLEVIDTVNSSNNASFTSLNAQAGVSLARTVHRSGMIMVWEMAAESLLSRQQSRYASVLVGGSTYRAQISARTVTDTSAIFTPKFIFDLQDSEDKQPSNLELAPSVRCGSETGGSSCGYGVSASLSQMMADNEGHTSFGLSADRYRNTDTISYFIDINRSLLGHKDIRFDTHLKQLFTGGASGGRPEYAINSVVRLPL